MSYFPTEPLLRWKNNASAVEQSDLVGLLVAKVPARAFKRRLAFSSFLDDTVSTRGGRQYILSLSLALKRAFRGQPDFHYSVWPLKVGSPTN